MIALLMAFSAGGAALATDPEPARSPDPGLVLEPPRNISSASLAFRLTLPQLARDGLAPVAQERYETAANLTLAGRTVGIDATVTALDPGPVLMQVEVYNAANVRVFEQKWDGIALNARLPRTLHATWTAPVAPGAGPYVVRIGIFAPGAGWGILYHWNNAAVRFALD